MHVCCCVYVQWGCISLCIGGYQYVCVYQFMYLCIGGASWMPGTAQCVLVGCPKGLGPLKPQRPPRLPRPHHYPPGRFPSPPPLYRTPHPRTPGSSPRGRQGAAPSRAPPQGGKIPGVVPPSALKARCCAVRGGEGCSVEGPGVLCQLVLCGVLCSVWCYGATWMDVPGVA